MSENILEIKNLSKNFGGLAAVSDCSISVKKGSITGVIGPNGSGKTTLFNLIAGNLKSSYGNINFNNEDITNVPSYELFSKGLLRTFQIAHEFSNLSVLENLMMVPANQSGENLINNFLKPNLIKQEENDIKNKAKEVVDFLNLHLEIFILIMKISPICLHMNCFLKDCLGHFKLHMNSATFQF